MENHLAAFRRDNTVADIRRAFHHLAFGSGGFMQRLYACIYTPRYKLAHRGRNSILEPFRWINREDAAPFNGRIIKGLRHLGFNVPL